MATFKQTFKVSIDEAFKVYHANNPQVYKLVEIYVIQDIQAKRFVSVKKTCNLVRGKNINTVDGITTFKLNDAYISRYARLFIEEHPELAEKIKIKKLRS